MCVYVCVGKPAFSDGFVSLSFPVFLNYISLNRLKSQLNDFPVLWSHRFWPNVLGIHSKMILKMFSHSHNINHRHHSVSWGWCFAYIYALCVHFSFTSTTNLDRSEKKTISNRCVCVCENETSLKINTLMPVEM